MGTYVTETPASTGWLYFNRLQSNGRSKAVILGDVEQAACTSEVDQLIQPYKRQ